MNGNRPPIRHQGRVALRRIVFAVSLVVGVALPITAGAPSTAAPGDPAVSGRLFVDFDRDGTVDANEELSDLDPLFPSGGITVAAFDSAGNSAVGTIDVGATPPTYSVDSAGLVGTSYRVEFTLAQNFVDDGWTETFRGPDSESSVQFVTAGDTTADFGVLPPSQCPTTDDGFGGNPNAADGKLFATCFINGDRDSAGAQAALVGFNYDRTGSVEKIGFKGNEDPNSTVPGELGSVWGITFDEWSGTLLTSAFLKRHVDLGTQGLAGLYWIDYPDGAWNSASLEGLGGSSYGTAPANRELGPAEQPNNDFTSFPVIGKVGIGDLDITPGGRTIVVTNLQAKSLMLYDISDVDGVGPAFVGEIGIPNPGCADAGANPADYQVFGLKVTDGETALAGVTCTAQTSQDRNNLSGHVVEVDLTGGVAPTSIVSFPLNYDRPCPSRFDGAACMPNSQPDDGNFQPWLDSYAPIYQFGDNRWHIQPSFSDIEVAPDGSLALGIQDRWGHQIGSGNTAPDGSPGLISTSTAGEILHVCNTSGDPENPTYVFEGQTGACAANFASAGTVKDLTYRSGPYGLGEWFNDEFAFAPGVGHPEVSNGGLYVHPYRDEIVMSGFSTADTLRSGGLMWLDREAGNKIAGFDLYQNVPGAGGGTFAKVAGIGDVEGCFSPIEIGDYVWLDLDGDGIQDPGEPPLAGVTVTITGPGLGNGVTVVTDENGNYVFDSSDGLEPATEYTISFDVATTTTTLPGGFSPADLEVTTQNVNTDGDDIRDSDVDGNGVLTATTGLPGINDHTFDAGFTLPYDVALRKTLQPGTFDLAAGTATFDIEVFNQGTTVTDFSVTDYIDPAVWQFVAGNNPDGTDHTADETLPVDLDFDGVLDEDFDATINEIEYRFDAATAAPHVQINFTGTLPIGQSVVVPITLTIADPLPAGPLLENWAEVSNFDSDGDPANGDAATGDLIDVDSTPDGIDGNGPGEQHDPTVVDHVDDEILEDGKQGGDEDDHDVAAVQLPYDLALRKTVNTAPVPLAEGADVTFDITIFNQGPPVEVIDVTDYIEPTDFEAITIDATTNAPGVAGGTATGFGYAWSGDGTLVPTVTLTPETPGDKFETGETLIVPVTLTIVAGWDLSELVNHAEISRFDSDGDPANGDSSAPGTGVQLIDVDSTPDTDNTDPLIDDVIDQDGQNGNDEDDHDIAVLGAPPFSLGNQVWMDDDNDGVLDPDEMLVPDVAITLYQDDDMDGVPDVDAGGAPIVLGTDITGPDGDYLFDGLDPGTYLVGVDASNFEPGGPLAGKTSSTPTEADPDDDVDDNDNGANDGNGGVISGPVTLGDGEPEDEPGLDNDPLTPDVNENLTVDFGFWTPQPDLALRKTLDPATPLPVSIGSQVTFVIEIFNQGNVDAADITVIDYVDTSMWTPFDAANNPAGTTGGDQALPFSWAADGTDGAAALTGVLPAGESLTIPVTLTIAAGADLNNLLNTAEISAFTPVADDDGDPNTPPVPVIAPDGDPVPDIDSVPDTTNDDPTVDDEIDNGGGDEDDHDIATVPPPSYSLGNQVWKDVDNSGTLDPGEEPVPGVTVELFADGNGDGVPDGPPIATTMTGPDGDYLFPDLPPGDYVVGLPPSNFEANGALFGCVSSDPTEADPNEDVDDNDNGIPNADGYVYSGTVDLRGPEPTNEPGLDNDPTTADANENLTVDFGFFEPPAFSLGNQVWKDVDNSGTLDPGEEPVPGVTVELFADADVDGAPDGPPIATTVTGDDGEYLFPDLPPGDYIVGLPPANFAKNGPLDGCLSSDPTEADANSDVDDNDNGIPNADGYVYSGTVDLRGPEPTNEPGLDNDPTTPDANENLTVDFGFWTPVFDLALRKRLDDGTNDRSVAVGDIITYTIEVFNQGEVTARDVEIIDYLPPQVTLRDFDWTKVPDGATIEIPGSIGPGESVTVDMTVLLTIAGSYDNVAEIAAAQAVRDDGSPILLPNGDPLPDIDSTPDRINSDAMVDDVIDNSGGDEDDHDRAGVSVTAPTLPGTGGDGSLIPSAVALLLVGAALTLGGRRRPESADAPPT